MWCGVLGAVVKVGVSDMEDKRAYFRGTGYYTHWDNLEWFHVADRETSELDHASEGGGFRCQRRGHHT